MHRNNRSDTYKSRLEDIKIRYGIKQYVKSFTRIRGVSKTVIDHFYSNDRLIEVRIDDNDETARPQDSFSV